MSRVSTMKPAFHDSDVTSVMRLLWNDDEYFSAISRLFCMSHLWNALRVNSHSPVEEQASTIHG